MGLHHIVLATAISVITATTLFADDVVYTKPIKSKAKVAQVQTKAKERIADIKDGLKQKVKDSGTFRAPYEAFAYLVPRREFSAHLAAALTPSDYVGTNLCDKVLYLTNAEGGTANLIVQSEKITEKSIDTTFLVYGTTKKGKGGQNYAMVGELGATKGWGDKIKYSFTGYVEANSWPEKAKLFLFQKWVKGHVTKINDITKETLQALAKDPNGARKKMREYEATSGYTFPQKMETKLFSFFPSK